MKYFWGAKLIRLSLMLERQCHKAVSCTAINCNGAHSLIFWVFEIEKKLGRNIDTFNKLDRIEALVRLNHWQADISE